MKLPGKIFICLYFALSWMTAFAQGVGINTSGSAPDPSAILDVDAVDKGVLLPRTTSSSIINPVEGIVIYDTVSHRFKYYNGMEWCALVQEGAYAFYWADMDGDGFGYPFNVIYSPNPPEFFVSNNDDCDDADPDISPGAPEVCDGIDNDCDGLVDANDPGVQGLVTYYEDNDHDEFGNPLVSMMACTQPQGYVLDNTDCNDLAATIYPGGEEYCDYMDNDCDGETDEVFNLETDPMNCGICGVVCDDGIPCTIDACVNGTCQFTIESNKCLIDDICYDAFQLNPGNECQWCDPSLSQVSWSNVTPGTPCNGTGFCNGNGVCVQ